MKHKKGKLPAVGMKHFVSILSQEMLAEYNRACEFNRRRKALRGEIITLLENGASVEPGPLTATLQVVEQLNLSWAKLEEVLGSAGIEAVRSQIEPTSIRVLRLHAGIHHHPYWQSGCP